MGIFPRGAGPHHRPSRHVRRDRTSARRAGRRPQPDRAGGRPLGGGAPVRGHRADADQAARTCSSSTSPPPRSRPTEAERLFAIVRSLRDRGTSVIFISHRLEELPGFVDTVTVLRDGHHVQTGRHRGDDADRRSCASWSGARWRTSTGAPTTASSWAMSCCASKASRSRVPSATSSFSSQGRRGGHAGRARRRRPHRDRPGHLRHRARRERARSGSMARKSRSRTRARC